MKNKTIIIPQENYGLIVNIFEENYIEEISKINIPYDSISKVVNNNQIVTLDKKNNQLLIHNLNGKLEHTIDIDLHTSYTMNVINNVVYIGGKSEKHEKCFFIDISNKEFYIKTVELPKVMSDGKAIDDIVFLENKMYLVDNIVIPKYTFVYDISEPTSPIFVKTINLKTCGTYEEIKKAQVNKQWMVYLSNSLSGYTGRASHILVESTDKEFYFKTYNLEKFNSENYYKDILLIDDTLYVLTLFGIGYFDLTSDELNTDDIVFIQHNIVADRIIPIDEKSLLLVNQHTYEFLDLEKYETITTDVISRRRDKYLLERERTLLDRLKGGIQ